MAIIKERNSGDPDMADENTALPATLYHYTSLQGLHDILTGKNIWATHIHYFNDRSEFTHAIELTEEILVRISASNAYDLSTTHIIKSIAKAFHVLANDISRTSNIGIYVTSFSENGDLLSQWRGYCNSGAGCSIGIDGSLLLDIADSNDCNIVKCNYARNDQKLVLQQYIERMLDSYSFGTMTAPLSYDEIDGMASDIYGLVAKIAPHYKDAAFEEENEWRLVPRKFRNDLGEVDFRVGKSSLIPYIKYNLNIIRGHDYGHVPVKEVIIGPALNQQLTKKSVEQLRHKLHIPAFQIRCSHIPFRTPL